jgi:hypothetical protein
MKSLPGARVSSRLAQGGLDFSTAQHAQTEWRDVLDSQQSAPNDIFQTASQSSQVGRMAA